MSRYEWPLEIGAEDEEGGDDPLHRAAYVGRLTRPLDAEGASQAVRRARAAASDAPARAQAGRKRPRRATGADTGPQRAPASSNDFLWQPLGPHTVIDGQTIGRMRIAGRVNQLAVHPDGSRVYAASGQGGAWFSADAGLHWMSLGGLVATPERADIDRSAQRHACGCIAVRFGATAADDKVFLGTGELAGANDRPGTSKGGVGVLIIDTSHPDSAPTVDDPWLREAPNLAGTGFYRIALEPDGTGAYAATNWGLYRRPAVLAADANWVKVEGAVFPSKQVPDTANPGSFKTVRDYATCTDVLWTAGDATTPERVWIWIADGAQGGLWALDKGAADFVQILANPPAKKNPTSQRAVIAVNDPAAVPTQLYLFVDKGSGKTPALHRIACQGNTKPTHKPVDNVPKVLGSQGWYDIALAIHPTRSDRVLLGGNTFPSVTVNGKTLTASGGTKDGAVVIGDVVLKSGKLSFSKPTMLGAGVHADVHDLVFTQGGNQVWAACDGGVFRCDHPTQLVGFVPMNDGLSVIESNFLACHPVGEGRVLAGLQDNGVIEHRSAGAWFHIEDGDAGGLALNPLDPTVAVGQAHNGWWSRLGASGVMPPLETNEAEKLSEFYSSPAAIAKGSAAQLLIGTYRLWFSKDFGKNWDHLASGADKAKELVVACRWQGTDVAWTLSQKYTASKPSQMRVQRYERVADKWKKAVTLSTRDAKTYKDKVAAPALLAQAGTWTTLAVHPRVAPAAVPGGPPYLGALYLGTTGDTSDATVDTLWWFNGTDSWFPTGLRNDPLGVPAPVTAIACDPAVPDEVWVGTTVGVWKGTVSLAANPPTWTWEAQLIGLPEAVVHDLSIFNDSGLRLLRAAVAARGVWELRLDRQKVPEISYLRAHDDDLRHRARATETRRDLRTPTVLPPTKKSPLVPPRSWHGSPDLRPRLAPQPAMPAPDNLPWQQGDKKIRAEALRRFQAALRAHTQDRRVRPTGVWDGHFDEVLRDLRGAVQTGKTVKLTPELWAAHVVAPFDVAEPWGAGPPRVADLLDFSPPLNEGEGHLASCSLPAAKLKMEVIVNRRGRKTIDGSRIRVTLLRWTDSAAQNAAAWNQPSAWPSAHVPWVAAVNEVLASATGTTAIDPGTDWRFAHDAAGQSRHVTLTGQFLDAMQPGVASFDLDLTGIAPDRAVLLVAVIRETGVAPEDLADQPPALVARPLQDLALERPDVAVRSIRVTA